MPLNVLVREIWSLAELSELDQTSYSKPSPDH